MNQMSRIPSFKDAQAFVVNRQGSEEVVRQSLYDFQEYPTGGFTSMKFFQVPSGQSGKTDQDTNMTLAGQLPQPLFHLTQSIEVLLFPGVDPVTGNTTPAATQFANDVYNIMKAGSLKLRIGSKDYLEEAPLMRFPPKSRMDVQGAVSLFRVEPVPQEDQAAAVENISLDYGVAGGRPYFLDPPILLQPTQNFDIELNFATAVPIATAARIGIVLDGLLYRLSQ